MRHTIANAAHVPSRAHSSVAARRPGPSDPRGVRRRRYKWHNYGGHNYIGHNNVGHNNVGHGYVGHNNVGHSYVGRDCTGPIDPRGVRQRRAAE